MPKNIKFYKITIPRRKEAKPHVIYDCSIIDISERREKALHFDTASSCSRYLGMAHWKTLNAYTSLEAIRKKKKYYSDKHNKYYAIRLK